MNSKASLRDISLIFTVLKRSLRRLCFYTCLSVILFTVGLHPGRGSASREGVCIQGGGLYPEGSASRELCIQGPLHPGRVYIQGEGLGRTPQSDTTGYNQRAGGTHPTRMHSSSVCSLEWVFKLHQRNNNVISCSNKLIFMKHVNISTSCLKIMSSWPFHF